MEKFYLEKLSISRRDEFIDYLDEFIDSNNKEYIINKIVDKYLNNDGIAYVEGCPSKTFLLIRKNDNKIVGSLNIRLSLNERLLKLGGHIGYGIRPSERGKGYSKINLYLGLIEAKKFNLDKVMINTEVNNIQSNKTLVSLGGDLVRTEIDTSNNILNNVYWFDVAKCLEKYNDVYRKNIYEMKYNIRKSIRDDSSKIAHVVTIAWNETYKGIVSDEILNNMYKSEKDRAQRAYDNYNEEENNQYVLEVDDEVVGFINIGKSYIDGFDGCGELYALYIIGKYKGFGFGKMLLNKAKEELKKMGYDKMVIGCLDKNPSNEFYKHMGGKYVKTHIFEKLNLDENLYLFDI